MTTKHAADCSIYCRIWVKGHLSSQWADWFGGLCPECRADGTTLLRGMLADQAALYGVLDRLRDLGLELRGVACADDSDDADCQAE